MQSEGLASIKEGALSENTKWSGDNVASQEKSGLGTAPEAAGNSTEF